MHTSFENHRHLMGLTKDAGIASGVGSGIWKALKAAGRVATQVSHGSAKATINGVKAIPTTVSPQLASEAVQAAGTLPMPTAALRTSVRSLPGKAGKAWKSMNPANRRMVAGTGTMLAAGGASGVANSYAADLDKDIFGLQKAIQDMAPQIEPKVESGPSSIGDVLQRGADVAKAPYNWAADKFSNMSSGERWGTGLIGGSLAAVALYNLLRSRTPDDEESEN